MTARLSWAIIHSRFMGMEALQRSAATACSYVWDNACPWGLEMDCQPTLVNTTAVRINASAC